jgi:hypothetical protein
MSSLGPILCEAYMYKLAPTGSFYCLKQAIMLINKGRIFYVHMQTADSGPVSNCMIVGERYVGGARTSGNQ